MVPSIAVLCLWMLLLASLRLTAAIAVDKQPICIECHVVVAAEVLSDDMQHQQQDDDDDIELQCWTKLPGRGFRESIPLVLPDTFVQDHWNLIQSGRAHVCISTDYLVTTTANDATKDPSTRPRLIVPESAASTLQLMLTDEPQQKQRRLLNTKDIRLGQKRLLAVRILGPTDEEMPSESPTEIRNNIFGPSFQSGFDLNAPATVASQYAAVSHGALQFIPAVGDGIQDGVAEVRIDTSIADADIEGNLMTRILESTTNSLGDFDSLADHIIFCLPNGSQLKGSDTWTAFTYLFEPYSYYQKSRCTRLSIPIHEMGHSLGFKHSGKEDDSYGDESGYMGYAVNEFHFPRKAFNAHKHWISGWFDNRAVALEQLLLDHGALALPLVAFVDASLADVPEEFAAVVRIDNLYMHYNRAKGYNIETSMDQKDLVTITSATNETEVSYFVAALASGETYSLFDYDGNGTALVIQVCDLSVGGPALDIDYATISIHLEDGAHTSICGSSVLSKSNLWTTVTAPSLSPTTSPVAIPSLSPTAAAIVFNNDAPSSTLDHPALDLNSNVVPYETQPNIMQHNSDEPEVLVENSKTAAKLQHNHSTSSSSDDMMFVLLLAVAGFLFVLAGGIAYCISRHSKDKNDESPSMDKKKPKLPDLDLSETEDSERDDDDYIIEIRRLPANYLEDQRFCEI